MLIGLACLCGLVVLAQMAWAVGSLERAFGEMRGAAATAGEGGYDFLATHAGWALRHFGIEGLTALALAIVAVLATRSLPGRALLRAAVPAVVQWLLVIVLFRGRSMDHGYFWLPSAVPYAICLVAGAAAAVRGFPIGRRSFGAGIVALLMAGVTALHLRSSLAVLDGHDDQEPRAIARSAEAHMANRALVLSPDPSILEAHLFSDLLWMPAGTVDQVNAVLRAKEEGRVRASEVWFLCSEEHAARYAPRLQEAIRRAVQEGAAEERAGGGMMFTKIFGGSLPE